MDTRLQAPRAKEVGVIFYYYKFLSGNLLLGITLCRLTGINPESLESFHSISWKNLCYLLHFIFRTSLGDKGTCRWLSTYIFPLSWVNFRLFCAKMAYLRFFSSFFILNSLLLSSLGYQTKKGRFNFTFRPHIPIWLFQTQHYFFFPSWSPTWLAELCALPAKARREEEREKERDGETERDFFEIIYRISISHWLSSRGEIHLEKAKNSTGVRKGERIIAIEEEVIDLCFVLFCFEFIIRFGTKILSAYNFSK